MNDTKEYSQNEPITTLETWIFTDLIVNSVGSTKVSKLENPLDYIAKSWGLNLSRTKQHRVAMKILKRSIKCN